MEELYLKKLDDFFAETYADYVKICAIEGYVKPETVVIDGDGNISRKDDEVMKISRQGAKEEVLASFKRSYIDCDYSFSFSVVSPFARMRSAYERYSFRKYFPELLKKLRISPEEAFSLIGLDKNVGKGLLNGKYLPEKNTVLSLALACRMSMRDTQNLLAVCGMELLDTSVRDIVVRYLIGNEVYNCDMQRNCLAEYHIECLYLPAKTA